MLTNPLTDSKRWRFLCALLIAVIGIASTIGSGSSGGSGGTPPIVTITDPPPESSTNATTQTVTGTASDESGVARITVNGVDATTTNGFANFGQHLKVCFW